MATSEPGRPDPTAWAALSDQEVVRRVTLGETSLFELIMRRYNQRLYRVARAIVRDGAEAEDVMQQAYVSAYTHLGQFADRAQFSTWLTRIVVHEAIARRRRRQRLTEIDAMSERRDGRDALTSSAPDPEQQAIAGEIRNALEASLDSLPEIYRTVFVLREVEGLSTGEAAQCLDTSEDVVKTRLHRARVFLRRELTARAGSGVSGAFGFHAVRCDRVVAAVLARLGPPPAMPVH